MASLALFIISSLLLTSVKGQADQSFTDSAPVDFYRRVSLHDCPIRFYPNPERYIFLAVFGGERARGGEFQHMVAIGWTTDGRIDYLCGGTLISPKFVLTAAHCAVNGDGNAPDTVRLGDTNLADIEDDQTAQQIEIHEFKKHPMYRPSRKYYDIALIELASAVEFNGAICPACLWLEREVPPGKMDAIGFGATGFGLSLSPTLQKVKLSALDEESCIERLPISQRALPNGYVYEQFCAGSDHMDTCEGDSGGPIQVERADINGAKVPLIVGLVSFGTPCTNGSIGVYTRIASYREWIEQQIGQSVDYLSCTRRSSCSSRTYSDIGIEASFGIPIVRVGLKWDSDESDGSPCGATLIDYRFALTTAYCAQELRGSPKYIVVKATDEAVEIDRIVIHPKFKSGSNAYDIALLKLSKYLNHNSNLLPACLLKQNEEQSEGENLWHYSAYSRGDNEQYTIVPKLHADNDCTSLDDKRNNITCRTHSIDLVPNVCNIDHGGPVYTTGYGDPVPYLYGLVSHMSEGCDGNLVAIKVSPHIAWIERTVFDYTDERLIFSK